MLSPSKESICYEVFSEGLDCVLAFRGEVKLSSDSRKQEYFKDAVKLYERFNFYYVFFKRR